MNTVSRQDVKNIVSIAGREGAIAALTNSKKIDSQNLADSAKMMGIQVKSKDSKLNTATQIVREVDRRITKSLDELKIMSKDQIAEYLERIDSDQDEIIDLLASIDLKARAKSRKTLVEFAAIQISSLGIFERLSDRGS